MTYLDTLKGVARLSRGREVEIEGGEIRTSAKGITVILEYPLESKGIYHPEALDLLNLGSTEIEAYLKSDTPIGFTKPKGEVASVGEVKLPVLVEAAKFVGKDEMRLPLTRVQMRDGDIIGTDGYKAYIKRVGGNASLTLSTLTIGIMKKYPKDDWRIDFATTFVKVSNGALTIYEDNLIESEPLLRSVLKPLNTTYKLTLPYKQLKTLSDKYRTKIRVGIDGRITLEDLALPLEAKIEHEEVELPDNELKVIMPLTPQEGVLVGIDLALLTCLKPDKSGNLTFRGNKNMLFNI